MKGAQVGMAWYRGDSEGACTRSIGELKHETQKQTCFSEPVGLVYCTKYCLCLSV